MPTEINPGRLIGEFSKFPHAGPIIDTFQHISDPETHQGQIDKIHGIQLFEVSALPRGLVADNWILKLMAFPEDPSLQIVIYEIRFGGLDLRCAMSTGYGLPEYGTLEERWESNVRMEGEFDATAESTRWLLDAIGYFGDATSRYLQTLDSPPEVRTSTTDLNREGAKLLAVLA